MAGPGHVGEHAHDHGHELGTPAEFVTIAGAPPSEITVSPDYAELTKARLDDLLPLAKRIIDDLTFPTVRAWTRQGKKAVACFPVYTPQEIIHAFGMLPVTLYGGGENIEISHADAPLGSFLCSISKSTLELALVGNLEPFSAFVFPYICDVSRNLEGIFARHVGGRPTHMLHLPQNFESRASVPFLVAEYRRLIGQLAAAAGTKFSPEALRNSITVFNKHRQLVAELVAIRQHEPWRISLGDYYLVLRLGTIVPREVHTKVLQNVLRDVRARDRKRKDAIRVLLVGPFCEQPPLDVLQLIEEAGCYVVADELQMLSKWHGPIPTEGDPLQNLAAAYVGALIDIGVRKTPTTKEDAILHRLKAADAQGVLFFSAKFCEPALEDVVLYRNALDRVKVPYLHMEFEEKSSAYEQARLQLETFVESIMFD